MYFLLLLKYLIIIYFLIYINKFTKYTYIKMSLIYVEKETREKV